MERKVIKKGDVLFEQGTPGETLVLIEKGELTVHAAKGYGAAKLVARLGPNDVVGEMSCLDPAPRSATVTASTDTIVRQLHRKSLHSLRWKKPKIGVAVVQSIIEQVNHRLRETDHLIQASIERFSKKEGAKQPASSEISIRATPSSPFQGKVELAKISTLKNLSPADLEILSVAAPPRFYPAKSILCVEGDRASSCYMLVSGKIDVLRRAKNSFRRLATLTSGALVGQLALVDTAPRTATLQAQTDVVVLDFARDDFNRLLDAESPLAIRFQEEVAVAGIKQLRKATQALASLPVIVGPEPSKESQAPEARDQDQIEDTLTYMQTALKEWGMSLKDLDKIRVKKLPGQLSASEIKIRTKT